VATTRKHKAKRKQNRSASLNARLWRFELTRLAIPICFPTKFRYRFFCEKCSNTIPVEPKGIVRHASSIDEAFTNFNAFAKAVEPRTIKCQCGHEDGYHRGDVLLVATDYRVPHSNCALNSECHRISDCDFVAFWISAAGLRAYFATSTFPLNRLSGHAIMALTCFGLRLTASGSQDADLGSTGWC